MQEKLNQRLFRILSAHKLEIPPLRDRKKDIPALMEHFVDKISKTRHIHAKKFTKAATNKLLNKHINLKIPIPSFVKNNDVWFVGVGFISILFMEKYTHMAYSINKTAYLIFGILLAAIIIDFVFEKSAWCRHLCPLGGLGGLFSMSSMIEIRSNRNTCTTICTTHDL